MTGQFYKNLSPSNTLNKELIPLGDGIELTQYMPLNILSPQLKVKSVPDGANYLYIPALNRYYYVSPPVLDKQCNYISCSVDVLMSNKTMIEKLECFIARNEFEYNENIPDSLYAFGSEKIIHGIDFGNNVFQHSNTVSSRNYIMTIK